MTNGCCAVPAPGLGLGGALDEYDADEARTAAEQPAGNRVTVTRWVLTQSRLWHTRQLATSQLRYLTLCGLTWILSNEVMHMSDELWDRYYAQLASLVAGCSTRGPVPPLSAQPPPVRDWLQQQRALKLLGMLSPERDARLCALGVDWQPMRSENERTWDQRLSELLAFQYEFGHCLVGCLALPLGAAAVGAQ